MIRDITLGQYYNSNSVLHRLDPRVKLFGTIIFLISLFSAQSVVGYVIATFALISLIVMSKVPFKELSSQVLTVQETLNNGSVSNGTSERTAA